MSCLPLGWINTRFEAIADIQLGKMLDRAKNVGLSTAYLRNINIRWGKVDTSDVLTMPMSNEDRLKFSIINGDVLVCEGGEPGRAAVWRAGPTDLKFQKAIMRVRAANGISPDWLAQYLRLAAQDGTLSERFTGTTIKHLPREALQATHLPVPPMAEQRRIVAKIDSLSAKSKRARDRLDHVPMLVERYKQAVLREAFAGNLAENGDAPFAEKLLGEIIEEGPANGWSPQSGENAQGALTLKLTATTSGTIRLDDKAVKRIHEMPPATSPLWLRPGDILVQRANALEHLGATAIYAGPHQTYIYPDLMMRVRVSREEDRRYLWRFLNSDRARWFFRKNATGTAGNMPKISGSTLKRLPVPFPAASTRAEVVRRIDWAFAWIDRLAAEATSARALIDRLDQAVLAKAFRGELVPQDPADEPASVLLERIRAERAGAPAAKRRGRPRAPALP